MQRRGAGHERRHGTIVCQEFRAIGIRVKVLVRSKGHEFFGINPVALREF